MEKIILYNKKLNYNITILELYLYIKIILINYYSIINKYINTQL